MEYIIIVNTQKEKKHILQKKYFGLFWIYLGIGIFPGENTKQEMGLLNEYMKIRKCYKIDTGMHIVSFWN